jgi:hypothetical protein
MGPPPAELTDWLNRWPALIDLVKSRDVMLAGVLRDCKPIDAGPGRLVIGTPFGFHREQLDTRREKLTTAVADFAGGPVTVETDHIATRPQAGGAVEQPGSAGASSGDAPPPPPPDTTQAVLSAFPGSRITGSRLRDHAHE